VWIVYPAARSIEIFDQPTDQPARTLGELDTLDGGAVLPDFTLRVAELFSVLSN
jgi:Uma2 family endonuclease